MHVITCPNCGRMMSTARPVRNKQALCHGCGRRFMASSTFVDSQTDSAAPAEPQELTPDVPMLQPSADLVAMLEGESCPPEVKKKRSTWWIAALMLVAAAGIVLGGLCLFFYHGTVMYEEYKDGELVFRGRISKEEWQRRTEAARQQQLAALDVKPQTHLPMFGDLVLDEWKDIRAANNRGCIAIKAKSLRSEPISELLVTVNLADKHGRVFKEAHVAPIELIPANGQVMFSVDYDSSLGDVAAVSLKAKFLPAGREMVCCQVQANKPLRHDDRIMVAGTAKNPADAALHNLRLKCEVFSDDGRLIGSVTGVPAAESLQPGETVTWTAEIPAAGQPLQPSLAVARMAGRAN
jgi:DNA-directed RNA polymerase subunit M/transcription elongation factor TFIIS